MNAYLKPFYKLLKLNCFREYKINSHSKNQHLRNIFEIKSNMNKLNNAGNSPSSFYTVRINRNQASVGVSSRKRSADPELRSQICVLSCSASNRQNQLYDQPVVWPHFLICAHPIQGEPPAVGFSSSMRYKHCAHCFTFRKYWYVVKDPVVSLELIHKKYMIYIKPLL